ncbi:MAG: hypothetical protein GXO48_07330 [Chlorobi bacterium]|nr:hypothetical protein [Chlorobiota bacterium]
MDPIHAFLTLVAWYKTRNPEKYEQLKALFKDLLLLTKDISKELENFLADKELDEQSVKNLYRSLFKNPHESNLISAINKFWGYIKEGFEIFNEKEIKEIEKTLAKLQNLIALVANTYHTIEEREKRRYYSFNDWKDDE